MWAPRSVLIVRPSCKAVSIVANFGEYLAFEKLGSEIVRVAARSTRVHSEQRAGARSTCGVVTPRGETRRQKWLQRSSASVRSALKAMRARRSSRMSTTSSGANVPRPPNVSMAASIAATRAATSVEVECSVVAVVLFLEFSLLLGRNVVRHRALRPRSPGTSTRDDVRRIAIDRVDRITPMG